MDWIEEIKLEELPRQYREMADIVGLRNTVKLIEYFGKTGFYFASLDSVIRLKKKEFIIKNFHGSNHKELARDTNYSERWVYEIVEEHRSASRVKQKLLFT